MVNRGRGLVHERTTLVIFFESSMGNRLLALGGVCADLHEGPEESGGEYAQIWTYIALN